MEDLSNMTVMCSVCGMSVPMADTRIVSVPVVPAPRFAGMATHREFRVCMAHIDVNGPKVSANGEIAWSYTTRPADPTDRTPEHPEATEVMALLDGNMIKSMGVWSMPHQAQDVADNLTRWGRQQLR